MTESVHPLSKAAQLGLRTLGQMIKTARLERGLSQQSLSERLGVSRYTIMSIEKGDPKVAMGSVFEAAHLVGIPLLGGDVFELNKMNVQLSHLASILPTKRRTKIKDLDDNF